ncbi:MAG: LysR substrate-binding domain-containing protein [bacterium]
MSFGTHPFTLRQLQYAVAVAETLSFRKAAERCHVSQPSLSAQLAELERAIGIRLFERDRRRVLVTEPAREILERARTILRETDDLLACARRSSDPLAGTLRIGVIPTVSPYLLPRLARALRAAHPRLTVMWAEDKTDSLLAKLDAGSLEAALMALEADIGDVEHARVGEDPFVLAASPGHPLVSTTAPATAADLREADVLLLDDGHCFRDQALAYCSRTRIHELAFRATSLSTLAQMVASGAGVTLLPRLALPTETKRATLALRPLAEPVPKRTVALVWRKRSPLGAALRTLAETAKAAYAAQDVEPRATRAERHPRARERRGRRGR